MAKFPILIATATLLTGLPAVSLAQVDFNDGPAESGAWGFDAPLREADKDISGSPENTPGRGSVGNDVFDIGYNEFFDSQLGKEPKDKNEVGLGIGYNDYFDKKASDYSPDHKALDSAYMGRSPQMTVDGFLTFRTLGPNTIYYYKVGYRFGEGLAYLLSRRGKNAVLNIQQTSYPGKKVRTQAKDVVTSKVLPGITAEFFSFGGNILDNRDIINHNIHRAHQILSSPQTYSPSVLY